MAEEFISLGSVTGEGQAPDQPEQLISLAAGTDPLAPPIGREEATRRALVAGIATSGTFLGLSPEEYVNTVESGGEQRIRDQMKAEIEQKDAEEKVKRVQSIATTEGPVTDEDALVLRDVNVPSFVNADTVIEREYARNLTNRIATNFLDPDNPWNKGLREDNTPTLDKLSLAQDVMTKQEIVKRRLGELQEAKKNQSWVDWGLDVVEQAIPGKTQFDYYRAGAGLGLFTGNTKEEVRKELLALPPDEFTTRFSEIFDKLRELNPLTAEEFAEDILSFTKEKQFLDNAFAALDAADVALTLGAGSVARKALRAGAKEAAKEGGEAAVKQVEKEAAKTEVNEAVRGAVTANAEARAGASVADVLEKGGLSKEAIGVRVQKFLKDLQSESTSVSESVVRVLEKLPTAFNPESVLRGGFGSLTRDAALRIVEGIERSGVEALQMLSRVNVERLSEEAADLARKLAKDDFVTDHPTINNTIIDVADLPADPLSNIYEVKFLLGDTNGALFNSRPDAEKAAEFYGLRKGTYDIEQSGSIFAISTKQQVDESKEGLYKALSTGDNSAKESTFIGRLFSRIRTPNETLSRQEMGQVNLANLRYRNVLDRLSELAIPKSELPNKGKDLERILIKNRDELGPQGRGIYYDTVNELETSYRATLGRNPTEKEVEAYFRTRQLNDIDFFVRNMTIYKEKVTRGLKKFEFNTEETKVALEGKVIDSFDEPRDILNIVMFVNGKYEPLTRATLFKKKRGDTLRNHVNEFVKKNNLQIVKIDNPNNKVFKDVLGGDSQPYEYVLTDRLLSGPIDPVQVNVRAGGHVIYKHQWNVSMPVIHKGRDGINFYEGDKTILNLPSRAQAQEWTQKLRDAVKAKTTLSPQDYQDYLIRNIPRELHKAVGAIDDADLLQTIQFGQKAGDVFDYSKKFGGMFKDMAERRSTIADEVGRKFLGAKEDFTAATVDGFDVRRADLIDPSESLVRGLNQATKEWFYSDVRTSFAKDFVERFGHLLDGTKDELVRHPIYHLYNGVIDPKKATDASQVEVARAFQARAKRLMGVASPQETMIEGVKTKALDMVYKSVGDKFPEWYRDRAVFSAKDPTEFFRAVAYHSTLGLFNLTQVAVQAGTFVHMFALSPGYAMKAMVANAVGIPLNFTRNPDIWKKAAKMSGMREDHFLEAFKAMDDVGWNRVGREHMLQDAMEPPKWDSGFGDKFLHAGTAFFRSIESSMRQGAWWISYQEWRAANPLLKLDNREIQKILARADTLTVNMTNASNSALQSGVLSIPGQFYGYAMRMMEQFTGKQLTRAEKARLFTVYSAVYGLPAGISAGTMIPVYEQMRGAALERGMEGDKVADVVVNGLYQQVVEGILGKDYSVGKRYAPGGVNLISDFVSGDKSAAEIMFGAAGGFVTRMTPAASNFASTLYETLKGESAEFRPLLNDLGNVFRQISSVNIAAQAVFMVNYHKYYSKNGEYLTDADGWDAFAKGVLGLDPQAVTDHYLRVTKMRDWEEAKKEGRKQLVPLMAQLAAAENDEQRKIIGARIQAVVIGSGLSPNEAYSAYGNALDKGISPSLPKTEQDFLNKAPPNRQKAIEDKYRTQPPTESEEVR